MPSVTTPNNTPSFQLSKFLLCVGAAAVFWLLNALNKPDYTLNVEYPIHFVYNDSLYIPTSSLPRTVTVNVSSDGWGLLRHAWQPFQDEPVDYVVRNPLQASIINTSSLTIALAEHIKRLRVNHVVADTLDLQFDRRMTKTIRLAVDSTRIDLVSPYVISSVINVTPRTIEVTGPAQLVRGLPDTAWIRIPRKRIVANYDEELPLNQFRHPLLHSSATKADVSFEIGELLSPQ